MKKKKVSRGSEENDFILRSVILKKKEVWVPFLIPILKL